MNTTLRLAFLKYPVLTFLTMPVLKTKKLPLLFPIFFYFLLSLYALLTTSRGADQIRTALLDNFVHTALRGIAAR